MINTEEKIMQDTINAEVSEEITDLNTVNTEDTEEATELDTVNAEVTEEVTDLNTVNTEGAVIDDEAQETPKKSKRELPAWIQKIVDYLNAHEDVRQMVFFLMFSVLCGASQLIVTYALSAGLKLEAHLGSTRLDWFVFHFATQAEFIGFLVGSVVGQVLTFVLNRKKTFNVPDHIALRAVMYAIMAILIIIMQTALGGAVTDACWGAKPDANGFLDLVFNLTGQAVAGIAAVIVNFLGNKFLVMRDWGKKKAKAENADTQSDDTTEAIADELTAQVAADDINTPQDQE